MLSAFRYHAGCLIHQWGLSHWGLHYCSLLDHTHGRHMCSLVMVFGPCKECTEWLLSPLLWVGWASCYSISCPPAFQSIWCGIQLWGAWQSHLISPPSLHGGEASSFPGLVPPHNKVDSKSVLGVKPGNSGVVISLMSVLTPGLQSGLLPIYTFILICG